MPSKLVTDRQKSADAVCMAAEVHADRVQAAVATLLSPHLDESKGEALPDVATLMRLLSRALRASKEGMIAADEAHEAQTTQAAKKGAMEGYDGLFGAVAGLLSHLLLVAGERELAAKVKPSARRPGQTTEEAEEKP